MRRNIPTDDPEEQETAEDRRREMVRRMDEFNASPWAGLGLIYCGEDPYEMGIQGSGDDTQG